MGKERKPLKKPTKKRKKEKKRRPDPWGGKRMGLIGDSCWKGDSGELVKDGVAAEAVEGVEELGVAAASTVPGALKGEVMLMTSLSDGVCKYWAVRMVTEVVEKKWQGKN